VAGINQLARAIFRAWNPLQRDPEAVPLFVIGHFSCLPTPNNTNSSPHHNRINLHLLDNEGLAGSETIRKKHRQIRKRSASHPTNPGKESRKYA